MREHWLPSVCRVLALFQKEIATTQSWKKAQEVTNLQQLLRVSVIQLFKGPLRMFPFLRQKIQIEMKLKCFLL